MDARWYNPQVGRFIQPDYYNFAQLALPNGARNKLLASTSLNTQMLLNDPSQQMRYGYVSGNPMRWVNPMGLVTFAEIGFAISHPIIANDIGFANPGTHNISNNTVRFVASTGTLSLGEGGEYNALRHAVWQAEITRKYGAEIAEKVGYAHENSYSEVNVNPEQKFNNLKEADTVVDILNNELGRNIGNFNNLSNHRDSMLAATDYFAKEGLYVVNESEGGYSLSKEVLDKNTYNNLRTVAESANVLGYTKAEWESKGRTGFKEVDTWACP